MALILPINDGPQRGWPGPPRPEFKNFTYEQYLKYRRKFNSTLHALGDAAFYWIPGTTTIMGRVSRTGIKGRHPLPSNAVLVGMYSWPYSGVAFVHDLDETISSYIKDHT